MVLYCCLKGKIYHEGDVYKHTLAQQQQQREQAMSPPDDYYNILLLEQHTSMLCWETFSIEEQYIIQQYLMSKTNIACCHVVPNIYKNAYLSLNLHSYKELILK